MLDLYSSKGRCSKMVSHDAILGWRHILYVNAEVDDNTEIAVLMKYFKKADPNDMSQGELSKRIHFLKCKEGGDEEMCEISEKIYKEGVEEGLEKGMEKGMEKGKIYGTVEVYKDLGLSDRDILKKLCLKGNVKFFV